MKKQTNISLIAGLGLAAMLALNTSTAFAGAKDPKPATPAPEQVAPIQHGPGFVDLNGDGFNDNAPDADGDGIPNGQDPDYTRPQDGSGQRHGWATRGQRGGRGMGGGFIDADGNGICDRFESGVRAGQGGGFGQGKGMAGRRGAAGTGTGTGVCDGTGPHGRGGGRR